METLSKEAEDRLVGVLEQVCHLVDSDKLEPNAAIIKVAQFGSSYF